MIQGQWLRCAPVAGLLLWVAVAPVVPVQAAVGLDQVYAIVNDGVITRNDFEEKYREVRSNYRSNKQVPPAADELAKQVLEDMVLEKLQLQVAERVGLRLPPGAVDEAIADVAHNNGMSVEQLQSEVAQRGMDYGMFRSRVARQLTINQLITRQIRSRVIVTEAEVDNYLTGRVRDEFRGREVDIGHIVVPLSGAADATELRDKRAVADAVLARINDGERFDQVALQHVPAGEPWDGVRMGWLDATTLPEFVLLALVDMEAGDHSGVLRGPRGFHIVKMHGARGGGEERLEQVHVRYIMFRIDAVVDADIAQRRLQALRQRVEQGEDFAELARQHSQDMLSRDKGGDIGWINTATLPLLYAQVLGALQPQEMSEPFVLGDRALIVQLLGRRHSESDDMRRLRARNELVQRKTIDEHERWVRQLRGRSFVRYNEIETPADVFEEEEDAQPKLSGEDLGAYLE